MRIKNIAQFRTWFKELRASRNTELNDENFMGSFHGDFTGFFGMYQGEKTDIYGFLRKEIEMAEDGQAVYEFLQNAADSSSTDFYMFFDEKNFLVINNGDPFEINGVKSILNVGQSYGKEDCGKIGRFGIGFKLVHRLVGKTSGLDELIKEYAGPQMLSWYRNDQIKSFINEPIEEFDTGDLKDQIPWLLKILITNFPAHPGETVKDLNFNDRVLYDWEEVKSFKSFFKNVSDQIDIENLNSGTAFYLRLGEGKTDLLKKEEESLLDGIENSMNFLKSINKVVVNGKNLEKSKEIKMEAPFIINPTTEEFKSIGLTEERDLACPAVLQIGYADYKVGLEEIKNKPNFYKYFPMGEETNGLNFILHSNVFGIESNRRKIHDSTINRSILKLFSAKMIELMEGYKISNPESYRSIFANILMSDKPASDGRNKWQSEFFYDELINYCSNNVPTQEGNYLHIDHVIIKKTELSINPKDFGVQKEWIYWDLEEDRDLLNEASNSEKLNLKRWGISKIIENSIVDKVNSWLEKSSDKDVLKFIDEIEKNIPKENFFQIQFLKCSDGCFYSFNELLNYESVIVLFSKIYEIKGVLEKLNLITTEIDVSLYKNICEKASEKISYLKLTGERSFFEDYIKPITIDNTLEISEKKQLFLVIKELYNVGSSNIKSWKIFNSNQKEIIALGELISSSIKVEPWLNKYQILKEEYFKELDDFLIQEKEIFPSVIFSKWDDIIDENDFNKSTIGELYLSVIKYYDDELHRGKSLNSRSYIFCENEFLNTGDVFYNDAFQKANDYLNLSSGIQKVTKYKTPSWEVLKFLSKNPFQTKNDKLIDYFNEVKVEESEAYEILRYCQETDTKIFSKVTLIEIDGQISLSTDSDKVQFFTGDKELIEFIDDYLGDSFVLLPASIEDFKITEGVYRNQELYEKIISKVNNIYELAGRFIPLLKHKEIIRSYIIGLKDIKINSTKKLIKDGFEYQLVSNIIQHFEEDEYRKIKDKFTFIGDDIIFKLSDINSSNEVQFDYDNKIYSLNVSEILPFSDSYSRSKIRDSLVSEFKKLELPKSKLEILFSIEIEEDDLIEKIAIDLLTSLNNKVLTNSDQLAFVLLYQASIKWDNFSEFKIYAKNDKEYKLSDLWYLNSKSFLSELAVISERYLGISKILNIEDSNPIFKVDEECVFLWKPCFDETGNHLFKYLEDKLEDENCIELLNFLFEEYNKRGKDSRRDFESIKDWSFLGDSETLKVLGFLPKEIIYTDRINLILESEKAPSWLIEWSDSIEKSNFLIVMGIHQEKSDILKIRRSLIGEIEMLPEELAKSEYLNERLLENTFEWICVGEIWENKSIHDIERVEILNSIIGKLNWDVDDYWSIDTKKLNEESEEWDDLNYRDWREDDVSFEVRLINSQIPYRLEYNDLTIAEHSKEDFWYDEDLNIFYCNNNKSILLLLQLAAEERTIYSDSIKALTNKGLSRVKELEEENKRLKSQLEKSDMNGSVGRGGNYIGNEEDIPTSELLDNTDERSRIAINEEAQQHILSTLKSKGYKVPSEIKIRFTIIDGIINPDDKLIKIVTKSAKGGTIYFNPSEWLALSEEDSQLFVVLSGSQVFNVTLDDLINNNDKFHLRFNTQAFAVKSNLKAFAQMVKYLPETHFLFKAPISTTDFFKEFGLNERNPTSKELSADDKDLLH